MHLRLDNAASGKTANSPRGTSALSRQDRFTKHTELKKPADINVLRGKE